MRWTGSRTNASALKSGWPATAGRLHPLNLRHCQLKPSLKPSSSTPFSHTATLHSALFQVTDHGHGARQQDCGAEPLAARPHSAVERSSRVLNQEVALECRAARGAALVQALPRQRCRVVRIDWGAAAAASGKPSCSVRLKASRCKNLFRESLCHINDAGLQFKLRECHNFSSSISLSAASDNAG